MKNSLVQFDSLDVLLAGHHLQVTLIMLGRRALEVAMTGIILFLFVLTIILLAAMLGIVLAFDLFLESFRTLKNTWRKVVGNFSQTR